MFMKSQTDKSTVVKFRTFLENSELLSFLKGKSTINKKFLARTKRHVKTRVATLLFANTLSLTTSAQALVSDPTVTAAITADMVTQKEIGEDTKKEMTKIQAAMLIIDTQMAALHKLESQYLDYLKTCSNTVEHVEQIWDIAEQIVALPNNLAKLGQAMKNKPSGGLKQAAITLFEAYHKEQTSLIIQIPKTITNCKTIISQLVLNGKSAISKDSLNFQFNVEQDPSMSYHKASLLNSYERIALLNQLKSELVNLNWKIRLTTYGVQYATWWGVFRAFDRESYYYYIDAERICKHVISTFSS